MITIFNRRFLIATMDMKRQSDIRDKLSGAGIAYTVGTKIFRVQNGWAEAIEEGMEVWGSSKSILMNIKSMYTKMIMKEH